MASNINFVFEVKLWNSNVYIFWLKKFPVTSTLDFHFGTEKSFDFYESLGITIYWLVLLISYAIYKDTHDIFIRFSIIELGCITNSGKFQT